MDLSADACASRELQKTLAGLDSIVHELRLKGPDGTKMMGMNGEFSVGPGPAVTGGQIRIPQVLNIERLTFPQAGRYHFDVSLNGEHHVSIPLFVQEAGGGMSPVRA